MENLQSKIHIPFAIEVVAGKAPAPSFSVLILLRAVLERLMSIAYIIEKMYLVLICEERNAKTMHRSVSPSLL